MLRFAVVLLLSWSQAQAPIYLEELSQVTDLFATASSEVLMYVPTLQLPELAEELRKAAYERDLPVFLLVSTATVYNAESFAPGLSLVPNLSVALADAGAEAFAVIDSTYLVRGLLLSRPTSFLDDAETVVYEDSKLIAKERQQFLTLWRGATPFQVDINRLLFSE